MESLRMFTGLLAIALLLEMMGKLTVYLSPAQKPHKKF
jgi:hypothetical protein